MVSEIIKIEYLDALLDECEESGESLRFIVLVRLLEIHDLHVINVAAEHSYLVERQYYINLLYKSRGNIHKAAKYADRHRGTIQNKIEFFKLNIDHFRKRRTKV